jgi:hypothetical protein
MAKKDYLFLQLRDLPYFRAFLHAVESSFYQDLRLSMMWGVAMGILLR